MPIFVFANNLSTTLANAAASGDTSITLSSSAGLPTLAAGQLMPLTLNDAATGLVYEVAYVTAIAGAVLTVQRAQEGTTAQNWNMGDFVLCCPTSGTVSPVTGYLQPTVTGTLPLGNNVVVQPGTIAGAIVLTLPTSPNVGTQYSVFGSASAHSVTVETSVSSGSPYMGFPTGSPVYSVVIPASSAMSEVSCVWDGTNWRCTLNYDIASTAEVGRIDYFARSTPPSGYLEANGAAVSRTTYANLYAAIGTVFGIGDGSTTFNLPDLRGEFIRGYDDSRGIDAGRVFGSWQKGTLTAIDTDADGVWCISTANMDGATAQSDIGADVYSTTDYPNGLLKGVTPDVSDILPGSAGAKAYSGVTRPRNIALLVCIKY